MTKLWWHVINNDAEPGYWPWPQLIHAAGIKLAGDDNAWKNLQFLSKTYPGKPLAMRFMNREGGAKPKSPEDAIAFIEGWATNYGLRHVWFQTFQNMPPMDATTAAWDAEMLRLARPKGLKLIAGDFSMGYPGVGRFAQADNPDLWTAYNDALEEINTSGPGLAMLGLQLYIGGGALEPGGSWDSLPLRYRELAKTRFAPKGWTNIHIFGTEAGFDAPNLQEAHISAELAAGALVALDKEWMRDSIMAGGALYTLDKSEWAEHGFDMRGGIFKAVTAYQAASGGIIEVPAPPPVPRPEPRGLYASATLNIRTSPHSTPDDNKVGQFKVETPVEVIGAQDGWTKIALWVKSEFVKEK